MIRFVLDLGLIPVSPYRKMIMDVGDMVKMEGWLVIIDYRLFLMPENYSDDYESGEKIEISNPEIIFIVADQILPLAGGKSFIFHRSKVSGVLISLSPVKIKLAALSVEERGQDFISISLESEKIEIYKARYEEFLRRGDSINSDDWLDLL
jgi:hypothetical protein